MVTFRRILRMSKKKEGYQLVIGICKDADTIIDITYNGIINNLNKEDLKDVYRRLELLKRDVRAMLCYTWWDRLKEILYGFCNR